MFSEFGLISPSDSKEYSINDLPPFMNPNTFYYYVPTLEETPPYGKIHVRDIIEIKKIDLKNPEADNILKKGIGNIGNGIISTVNKITEITKLEKLGMHIHRFEYQF